MLRDEHTIGKSRILGVLGPKSSSFTLGWLALHRTRLRTLIFGGRHLSILLVWDKQAGKKNELSELDQIALKQITEGAIKNHEGGVTSEHRFL